LPEPDARPVGRAVLAHRAFPQRHRDQPAARFDRHAVAGRVRHHRAEVLGGGHELAPHLGSVRGRAHLDARAGAERRVEQPDLRAALVDDAPAVALRVARV